MTEHWSLCPTASPSSDLIDLVGGERVVAKILTQRGFDTPAKALSFLDPSHYRPASPDSLCGVEHAARLIHESIAEKQNILVWGDFDVDGQTSTALLVSALRRLVGRAHVSYHVPNRFSEGHGMRLETLQAKLDNPDFTPNCLLTCDTGIAEDPAISYAKRRGLRVVITDHHDPSPELLQLAARSEVIWGNCHDHGGDSVQLADAIVNPKFQKADDPLRTLPGVGVAYKLTQQLYALSGQSGAEHELLDLVALGIVADVAEQICDTRYLLQRGLEQLRSTQRLGLLALIDAARLAPASIDSEAIAFQLAPRMNSVGRLEDASVAVELLTTTDPIRAGQLAAAMERLNQRRQLLTKQVTAATREMIERNPQMLDYNALVLAHPAWHPGIVGIVASRLVEEFNKPAVLLITAPGKPARGSARSLPSVDISGAIAACDYLLVRYGGHPGAAGLTLAPENIDRFREELHRQIDAHRIADAPEGFMIDAELELNEIGIPMAEQLRRLAPFGQGNRKPKFVSHGLEIVEDRRVGSDGNHRRLEISDAENHRLPVIWFNSGNAILPSSPVDMVYTVGLNEYRGQRGIQLGFVGCRPAQATSEFGELSTARLANIHDLRHQVSYLSDVPSPRESVWYAEGMLLAEQCPAVNYSPRTEISASRKRLPLVVWSIPPTSTLLHWLCDTVAPTSIYLCGRQTADDSLDQTLRHVAGMCRYALDHDNMLYIDRLAARLGTSASVIHSSLLWLESRGQIVLDHSSVEDAVIAQDARGALATGDQEIIRTELAERLEEVSAYRRYYLRATLSELGLPRSAEA